MRGGGRGVSSCWRWGWGFGNEVFFLWGRDWWVAL